MRPDGCCRRATRRASVSARSKTLAAQLKAGFKKAGKKLNMGKSCIRFRRAEDLDLDTIGKIVAKVPVSKYIAIAKAARRS